MNAANWVSILAGLAVAIFLALVALRGAGKGK